MTKKNVLLIGILGTISFFTVFVLVTKYGCREDLFFFCRDSYFWFNYLLKFLFPVILFLSIITYKMQSEVFKSWIKFAYVWIPLTIILTVLSPSYSQSLLPITKGVVSFSLSTLSLLISLIIIISKHLSLKKNS